MIQLVTYWLVLEGQEANMHVLLAGILECLKFMSTGKVGFIQTVIH